MILENYLQYIQESIKPNILYHGSSFQNLKIIDPEHNISKHDMEAKTKWIYAGDTKLIASAFTFFWYDDMGIHFGGSGTSPTNKVWTFKIPKKLIPLMNKPCSIYTVSGKDFIEAESGLKGEFITTKKIKVLKEDKYRSSKECMLKHNIKIKVI